MTKKELKQAITQNAKEISSIKVELKDAKKDKASKWTIKELEKELDKATEKQMDLICIMIDSKSTN